MKLKTLAIGAGATLLGLMSACGSTFTTQETEHAIVKRFGKPYRIVLNVREPGISSASDIQSPEAQAQITTLTEKYTPQGVDVDVGAGLYFKLPIVDSVEYFEARGLEYDAAPRETITVDKRQIVVDTFARWFVWDPLQYRKKVKTPEGMNAVLDDIVYAKVRDATGRTPFVELVRSSNQILEQHPDLRVDRVKNGRDYVMGQIAKASNEGMHELFGAHIADVRMKRAELPEQNRQSVYARMISERQRISKGLEAEGEQLLNERKASVDRQVTEITSAADKIALRTQGQADADVVKLNAEAVRADPEFFSFWRTMEAYRNGALKGSTVILERDSDFVKYLQSADRR